MTEQRCGPKMGGCSLCPCDRLSDLHHTQSGQWGPGGCLGDLPLEMLPGDGITIEVSAWYLGVHGVELPMNYINPCSTVVMTSCRTCINHASY